MRIIVISDIHGCYREFMGLLEKVKYDKYKDRLLILGDMIDRGPSSREVVEFAYTMSQSYDVQVTGGNHELWFLDWLDAPDGTMDEYFHPRIGGFETVHSFSYYYPVNEQRRVQLWIKEYYQEQITFIRNLPDFLEDENHIYVHAGINPFLEDWRRTSRRDFRQIDTRFYLMPHEHPQTVVFGHTPTSKIRKNKNDTRVWFGDKQIGIDGGCVFGGKLHALIIEEDTYKTVSV